MRCSRDAELIVTGPPARHGELLCPTVPFSAAFKHVMKDGPMVRRKRVKQERSFEDRLLGAARDARAAARNLPPGKKRELLLRSARDNEAAVAISRWISSPGLKVPE